jgi:hypothetical protein
MAISVCAAGQTSHLPQAWTAAGQWSAPVAQDPPVGPLAVDASGDLLVADGVVGVSSPTKILGAASAPVSSVSKLNGSGVPVFAVQMGGVYRITLITADSSGNVLIAGNSPAVCHCDPAAESGRFFQCGRKCFCHADFDER